jgi:hypothetical protein
MDTSTVLGRNELFSAMNGSKPYQSYKKTILAQAAVTLWDTFMEAPTQIIVKGDPKRDLESCIIDVWSEKEKVFFERMNRRLFNDGTLIPYNRPEVVEKVEKTYEQFSDEELVGVVNSKFLALQSTLNKMESVAVLFRLKNIAEENEKSEKIVRAIEARISEVQNSEYQPKAEEA